MFSDYESAAMRQERQTWKSDKKKKNTAHGCTTPGNMGNHKNTRHGISVRLALVSNLAVTKIPCFCYKTWLQFVTLSWFRLGVVTVLSLATYPFPCSAGGIMG
jgi:hypothetical protein